MWEAKLRGSGSVSSQSLQEVECSSIHAKCPKMKSLRNGIEQAHCMLTTLCFYCNYEAHGKIVRM